MDPVNPPLHNTSTLVVESNGNGVTVIGVVNVLVQPFVETTVNTGL